MSTGVEDYIASESRGRTSLSSTGNTLSMFADASQRRRTTSNVLLSTACMAQAEGAETLRLKHDVAASSVGATSGAHLPRCRL